MTTGFELQGSGLRSVAASLRDDSDLAARAGSSLAQLGQVLAEATVGERLLAIIDQFSADWCEVLEQAAFALAELAGWLDEAVTGYFSVDSDTAYRFGWVHQ